MERLRVVTLHGYSGPMCGIIARVPELDFVAISGGVFMMGDQRESPDANELPVQRHGPRL